MANGLGLVCSKCGKEYDMCYSSGFDFMEVYRDTFNAIRNGYYGENIRRAALNNKKSAIDAYRYIYKCWRCSGWKSEVCGDLYVPNHPEEKPVLLMETETFDKWEDVPFVSRIDLKEKYHVIKRCIHRCDKCNSRMHKVNEKHLYHLRCPYCGGKAMDDEVYTINWD